MSLWIVGVLLSFELLLPIPLIPATASQDEPPRPNAGSCSDSVFRFQANFWINLHLFLRAESRRRRLNAPQQMSVYSLAPLDASAWNASLDA
jgi:hypothetical protein